MNANKVIHFLNDALSFSEVDEEASNAMYDAVEHIGRMAELLDVVFDSYEEAIKTIELLGRHSDDFLREDHLQPFLNELKRFRAEAAK